MLIPTAGGGRRVGAVHSVVTLETEESGTKLLGLLESEAGWLWALVGFCRLSSRSHLLLFLKMYY